LHELAIIVVIGSGEFGPTIEFLAVASKCSSSSAFAVTEKLD
jgi:hypothetical protein